MDKFAKSCTTCGHIIDRKNFRAVVSRCLDCGHLVCTECAINGLCINCYISDSDTVENYLYWREKYSHGVAV